MATITYFILPSVIKDRMSLHDNVDDKLIYPEIYAVQNIVLLPLLGTHLYKKMLTDIAAGSLTGNYKTLMDDYIIDIVCNLVMARLPEALNYQLWNKGVSVKTAPDSQNANQGEVFSVKSKYKNDAEHYIERTRLYLIQYANTLFPEYMQTLSGVDQLMPTKKTFTSPIFIDKTFRYEKKHPFNRFVNIYE